MGTVPDYVAALKDFYDIANVNAGGTSNPRRIPTPAETYRRDPEVVARDSSVGVYFRRLQEQQQRPNCVSDNAMLICLAQVATTVTEPITKVSAFGRNGESRY